MGLKFLIPDGYPKKSRDQFDEVGMTLAGILYEVMVKQYIKDAECTIIYTSDGDVEMPDAAELEKFDALLWPGCNLTIYHTHDERVQRLVNLSRLAYEVGLPQFGSCWGVQMAAYAAGGKVAPNPKGREMGVGRKIYLTDEGRKHPMYEGKPPVFDGFVSHDDEVVEIPEGGTLLASNSFTKVQALEVRHKKGIFWATQYHTEYNLKEVARLILAREEKLIRQGFFKTKEDLLDYSKKLEAIHNDPSRKDLKWQLGIEDDIVYDSIRQIEFVNFLNKIVIPKKKGLEV